MEELLTPDALAALLHVPVASVYRWNHLKTGPTPLRVGRHVRYRLADVEEWLVSRQQR